MNEAVVRSLQKFSPAASPPPPPAAPPALSHPPRLHRPLACVFSKNEAFWLAIGAGVCYNPEKREGSERYDLFDAIANKVTFEKGGVLRLDYTTEIQGVALQTSRFRFDITCL